MPLKLTGLMPEWVNYMGNQSRRRYADDHSHVDYHPNDERFSPPESAEDFAHADGILFLCPTCIVKNNGPIGTESVCVWFANRPNVPAAALPGPGRWTATGTSFDDLTLTPSVNVNHEHWHGFIRNGVVTP